MKKTGIGYQIGELIIPYYGLYIVIGVLAAFAVGYILIKKNKKDVNDFITILGIVALGAILGAKILYLIISWKDIEFARLLEPEYFSNLMQGGFVFYGGVIGGVVSLVLIQRFLHLDVKAYVNIGIPCIPIFHGFGRLGCNGAGCCYGMPYEGPFARVYENSLIAPNDISLFPVQTAEAIAEFMIAIVLILYICYAKDKKYSLSIYLMLYVPVRFVLEYFRGDALERKIYWMFSTSQWISIFVVLVIGGAYIFQRYYSRKVSGINKNQE